MTIIMKRAGLRATGWKVGLIVTLVFAAFPALSNDGVVEINQVCAVHTGCFSGDAIGFPVIIDGSAGRSYRLTSDLVQPTLNTDVILVSAPSITIDLNGFEIVGAGCVGATVNCTPITGTGSGIERATGTLAGTKVLNGSVTGMGRHGIFLGTQSEVVNVSARWNRFDGILVGPGSSVSGSVAYQNNDDGIEVGPGSLVFDNATYLNGNDGIVAGNGANVFGNTSSANGDDGIQTSLASLVRANTVRGSSDLGLALSAPSSYRENVVTTGTGGAGTISGGVDAGANACDGSTTCP